MNHKAIRIAAALLLSLGALCSCDRTIYDAPGDCNIALRFRYDYNMKYADAFPAEVSAVDVFLFDRSGRFVSRVSDSGAKLSGEGYTMSLPGVMPGTYDVVVWGGLKDGGAYSVANPATKQDLLCSLRTRTKADVYTDSELEDIYYGHAENVELRSLPDGSVNVVRLDLMKNTNRIHVVLQALNDLQPLEADKYDFIISDEGTAMNWANERDNFIPVDYLPFEKHQGTVDYDDYSQMTAAVADFTTGRLFPSDGTGKTMLNVVDLETGKTVISVPLVDYFLLVKGRYEKQMTDQEYLDRQDDYTITFFLDNRHGWNIAAGIFINGWRIILQNSDLDNQ